MEHKTVNRAEPGGAPSRNHLDTLSKAEADLAFIKFAVENLALRVRHTGKWRNGVTLLGMAMRLLEDATEAPASKNEEPWLLA